MPWITAPFLYSRAPTHLTSVLVWREAPLRSLPGSALSPPSNRAASLSPARQAPSAGPGLVDRRRVLPVGFIGPSPPLAPNGYRLIVRRDSETARLCLDGALSPIAAAAAKPKAQSFTLDGKAVVAGADGVVVLAALH
jgi:hypothetical protein